MSANTQRIFRWLVANRATTGLVFVCLIMAVGVTTTMATITDRRTIVTQKAREGVLWAAFQLDRETLKLQRAVSDASNRRDRRAFDELGLRFDILLSAVPLLQRDEFAVRVGNDPRLARVKDQIQVAIEAVRPRIEKMISDSALDAVEIHEVQVQMAALQGLTETCLTTLNEIQSLARVREREEAIRTYHILALGVAAMAVSFCLLVYTLSRQLRHAGRSRQELERLNAGNQLAAIAADAGNRAKSVFLATISHEIRTPLNGIIVSAGLIDRSLIASEQRVFLDTIHECGRSLLQIINDILDLTKLESGTLRFEYRPFNLSAVIEGALDIVSPRARIKDIGLIGFYPPLTMTGDETRVRQVLVNLCGNAVKFTDKGDVAVVAGAAVDNNGKSCVRIEVRDTGIGIAAEGMQALFRDFNQVDDTISRRYGGSGLGLAICKRLIDGMGGQIGVESTVGVGSSFWFTIPFAGQSAEIAAALVPLAVDLNLAAETDMASKVLEAELGTKGRGLSSIQNRQSRTFLCKRHPKYPIAGQRLTL